MKNLRNMFRFAKPETPGFGISANFYITTFIPTTQLPAPVQICNPSGEGGAELGMIAPLDPGATKQALVEPLRKGNYVIASLDKKTVIELNVDGLSTTGYDPPVIASTAWAEANLRDEIRTIMRSTWLLAQFRFRSHHPEVGPAMQQIHGVASRLAELTGGLVCDPMAQKFELGPRSRVSEALNPTENVTFIHETGFVLSCGMAKFAMPEVCVRGFSQSFERPAARLLVAAIHNMLHGKPMAPGDKLSTDSHVFRVVVDPEVKPGASPILELIPDDVISVDEALADFVEA